MLDQIEAFFSLMERFKKYTSPKPEAPDSVASRFIRLFEKHGVHRNQIPRFFDHGLTLADVASNENLLAKLTPEILHSASNLFAVRLKWLEGVDEKIYETHDFYKQPEEYRALLANLVGDKEQFIGAKLVWSTARQCQEDALLILKETIAEHGN